MNSEGENFWQHQKLKITPHHVLHSSTKFTVFTLVKQGSPTRTKGLTQHNDRHNSRPHTLKVFVKIKVSYRPFLRVKFVKISFLFDFYIKVLEQINYKMCEKCLVAKI